MPTQCLLAKVSQVKGWVGWLNFKLQQKHTNHYKDVKVSNITMCKQGLIDSQALGVMHLSM